MVATFEVIWGPVLVSITPPYNEIYPPFPVGQEFQLRYQIKNRSSSESGKFWTRLTNKKTGESIYSHEEEIPAKETKEIWVSFVGNAKIKEDMTIICDVGHFENGNRIPDHTYTWEIPVKKEIPLLKPVIIAIAAVVGGILIYKLIK